MFVVNECGVLASDGCLQNEAILAATRFDRLDQLRLNTAAQNNL